MTDKNEQEIQDFIKNVASSSVYDVAVKTPLILAPKLSKQKGVNVYFKREDLQPIHSFKIRGAYQKISKLDKSSLKNGIIAASAGNHAQGVALSAKKLGIKSKIIMPRTTPHIKVEAVKDFGSEVELWGDSYSDAAEYSYKIAKQGAMTYIHPFDDYDVITGQATIGAEIIDQLAKVTHIFIPVGGGGLVSGIAAYVKNVNPNVRIIGVEPEDSSAMKQSVVANKIIELKNVGTFADGVAVKKVGEKTFQITQQYVDEIITVTTDQTCSAIQSAFEENRVILEPAGALAIAGISTYFHKPDSSVHAVAICSGANMSFERLQFVSERTLLGSGRESLYAIELHEKPGALLDFCEKVIDGHNIVEFGYRLNSRKKANIFVGIKSNFRNDDNFNEQLRMHGYQFIDLSNDEVAKEHVRYMIGGHSDEAINETLYIIEFPERPGALLEFLKNTNTNWNISLFHYRSLGGDIGKVLIGFEAAKVKNLELSINDSGLPFKKIDSKAASIFLQ